MGGAEGRGNSTDQPTNQRTVGVEGTKKANVVRQSASITHPSSGINNTKREGDKRPPNYHASSHTRSHQRGRAPTSFGLFLIEGTVECDTASFMLRFLAFLHHP